MDAASISDPARTLQGPPPGGAGPARSERARSDAVAAALRRDLVAYIQRRDRVGDVEDIVQEAFARFHRAGHDLTAPDARPLLFVIARNLQLDGWKAARRNTARRGVDDVHGLDAGAGGIAGDAPSADRRLIGRQDLAAASAIIRSLPPKTRDAFLLHRFEALTYRQIGERLSVSVSMVEKHIAEALRQLRTSRDD